MHNQQAKTRKSVPVMVRINDQELYRAIKTLSYMPLSYGYSNRRGSVGGVILKLLKDNADKLKAKAEDCRRYSPLL
jgi:hypothetical protein